MPELSGMGAKLGIESGGKNISLMAFNTEARGTFGPKGAVTGGEKKTVQ